MSYAENTTVSVEKSRAEIEKTLSRYGATSFASGWTGDAATIVFEASNRRVRFVLPMPDRKSVRFTRDPRSTWRELPEAKAQERYDQEVRRLWRCLALAIKAKLEVVESGIATFEEEFLANIVLPNRDTVGNWMAPQIEQAYQSGAMPPLLLGPGGS